jgi:hypothetical protein
MQVKAVRHGGAKGKPRGKSTYLPQITQKKEEECLTADKRRFTQIYADEERRRFVEL